MLDRNPHRWLPSLLGLFCLACAACLLAPAAPLHAQDTPAGSTAGATAPPHVTPQVTPPPAFDPLSARPAGPLPGGDYPAAAASLPPPLEEAGALGDGGRPDGIDLDVLYIERTPKYERYAVTYADGVPVLSPGSENAQRWPAPNEVVTFTAHVMNKGTQRIDSFGVAWYIDGQQVKSDASTEILWPDTEAVFTLQWAWGHRLEGERLLDAHSVRLVADPDGQIAETFETNNEIEDRTDALALEVVIAPQAYYALNSYPQAQAAFSAEDWVQRHARAFNTALAASIHPAAPNGVGVRVRIDKIRIAWEQPLVDLGYDGGWFINADYRSTSIYYHADEDLDWGMLHEWGHQLGLIDTYRYLVNASTVDVLREDGSPYGSGYDFPGDGLMETVGSKQLDEFNAAGLNTTQGYRRGYYGESQFDLAPEIVLALTDLQGCAVPNATVAFYQRNAAQSSALGGEPDVDRRIDNQPEFVGATDADGLLPLPNRPSSSPQAGPLTTATGHTLHDNPFGAIEVVGSGNIGLLKVQKNGREQFVWLTAADLNLDYWRQGKPAVQKIELVWEEDGGVECPPNATPTPSETPTVTPTATPTATPTVTPAPSATPQPSTTPVPTATEIPVTPPVTTTPVTTPVTTPAPETPVASPPAPAALAAEPAGQSQTEGAEAIGLSWQEAGAAAEGYYVEWAHGDKDWALLATIGPNVVVYTVEGLACGSSYRFRVAAYNRAGVSPYSTELVYTTVPCAVTLKKLYLPVVSR